MPARSALGYFFAMLLELLKAKFWTETCALDSFCDDAMRKEPWGLSLLNSVLIGFVTGNGLMIAPLPWL